MKVRVNKKWWQFWLPSELDVKPLVVREHTPVGENPWFVDAQPPIIRPLNSEAGAVEADEDIPWYGQEGEESSVVTAEPPIVSASRGNAKVAERKERAKMQ